MKPGMFEDWRSCAKAFCFIALCCVMIYVGYVIGEELWP